MDRQTLNRKTQGSQPASGSHASHPPGGSKADRRRRRRRERRLARQYRAESPALMRLKQVAVGASIIVGTLVVVYGFFIYK